MGPILAILFGIIIVALLVSNVRIVPQATVFVIERLGAYYATWEKGLHFKVPILDRVAKKISLKEQVMDFAPQPVITKDNVTMQIDSVVYFQITDPKKAVYEIDNLPNAIEKKTPIGSKIVIEKFVGPDGKEYADVNLVYQSVEQLKNMDLLDLDNPPMIYPLTFKGMQKNADGLYEMADVLARFEQAMAAYQAIP